MNVIPAYGNYGDKVPGIPPLCTSVYSLYDITILFSVSIALIIHLVKKSILAKTQMSLIYVSRVSPET
jgi:hypothetical protein